MKMLFWMRKIITISIQFKIISHMIKNPLICIDYCHYDSLAMVELGKLFANAMLSFDVLH